MVPARTRAERAAKRRAKRAARTARTAKPERRDQDAGGLLTPEAQAALRQHIANAGGHEVFFSGKRRPEGERIAELRVIARGNRRQVPAILERLGDAEVAIHNHPGGDLTPSDADLDIASVVGANGLGFWIVDNAVAKVNVIVPIADVEAEEKVREEEIAALFAEGGPIAEALPGYEPREAQVTMAMAVARALSGRRHLLCEAGTGTGKTFAYLVPAVLWACRNRKTVVVSTGTINLQEQIAEKDIPFLQRGFLPRFRAELLKGRSNYVSLRRAAEAEALGSGAFDNDALAATVLDLTAWAKASARGERSEVVPAPRREAWEFVESQSDNCLKARCPRYKDCRYYDTRRRARGAQILIVNHHLLLADLAAKVEIGSFSAAAILPPYQRLIIDEAHKLEDIAGAYFGAALSEYGIRQRLGRLLSRSKARRGLVPALARKAERHTSRDPSDRELLRGLSETLRERVAPLVLELGDAFEETFAFGRDLRPFALGEEPAEQTLRLQARTPNSQAARDQEALLALLGECRQRLDLLIAAMKTALGSLDRLSETSQESLLGPSLELSAAAGRLEALGENIGVVQNLGDEDAVRWFETRLRGKSARSAFHAVPLEVGAMLSRRLWTQVPAAVLTSATLAADGGFAFLRRQLGFGEEAPADEARLDSPFDFARQAVLAIPRDHSEVGDAGFFHDTCYAIEALTDLSRGRCFVLFTSRAMLRQAARVLRGPLESRGLVLLSQGELSRRELLRRFKSTPGAVLFGNDSFWEGVDVPGDQLSLVILVKMPFKVPTEPLQEARAERLERAGRNPFMEMTLPQATLKLRQGFGRLIRSRSDRGAVVIFDHRLLSRRYGPRVLDALPPVERCFGALESEVIPAIARFLEPST